MELILRRARSPAFSWDARRIVIESVLATDMAKHFETLSRFGTHQCDLVVVVFAANCQEFQLGHNIPCQRDSPIRSLRRFKASINYSESGSLSWWYRCFDSNLCQ